MLLDNKKNGKVGDELKKHLSAGKKLSVMSGLFSIYGFEALKKELKALDSARFLLFPTTSNENGEDGATFPMLEGP